MIYSPPWLGRRRWPPGVTSRVTANFRVITPISAGHPVGLSAHGGQQMWKSWNRSARSNGLRALGCSPELVYSRSALSLTGLGVRVQLGSTSLGVSRL